MVNDFLYFNQSVVAHPRNFDLPGMEKFSTYFKLYNNATIASVDRTGIIRTPIRMRSVYPMPRVIPIRTTFEELCNERARELLQRAEKLGSTIHVFWSGGIDSTLILVSFLKTATKAQLKNIVVLMTEDSIRENPNFYRDHVRGTLRVDSATMFPYLLGTHHILLGGEGNDQLFGSDMLLAFINAYGPSVIHAPYARDKIVEFYNNTTRDETRSIFYFELFEKLAKKAPVPIVSLQDYLWWINFSIKWQSVFMRVLSYPAQRQVDTVGRNYVGQRYDHFFHTEKFQLWSLNNLDKRIKDEWRTYKWVCKDIIYDYTKDADYRDNKTKRGSLYTLLLQRSPYCFIDSEYRMYDDALPREEYYDPVNDFL